MKILFINTLADTELGGGAEVILWEQIRGLSQKGHECVLLATSNTPGLTKTEIDGFRVWRAGIRNLYWPMNKIARRPAPLRMAWHALDGYNVLMQSFIREVCDDEKPDLVSLHNLAGWSAATYRTLVGLGLPAVQILHDYYLICVKSTMRALGENCAGNCMTCRTFRVPHRRLTRNVQAVVGVSRFVLDQHIGRGYFAGVPIQRVIHNARKPGSLGLKDVPDDSSSRSLRFGYIGALSPVKGVRHLLEAFLAANLPNTTLWIAGNGKQSYEQQLRGLGSDDSIVFKGRMTPQAFYRQVDVVVVPSLWNDNLPGVVFEALAFGKPVIGSRRGGIPEMIRDGYNGLLFEPENDGELAACLSKMHDDTSMRAQLTANAKPSSAPFVDFDGWIDQYERLYGEVAAAGVFT